MAAQVNSCLSLDAFLSRVQCGAWKLAHVCPLKVLLTYKIILKEDEVTLAHKGDWEYTELGNAERTFHLKRLFGSRK